MSNNDLKKSKKIRVEYKILIFFVLIFLMYVAYEAMFESVGGEISPQGKNKRSISEAVQSDRPLVIDTEQIKEDIKRVEEGSPEDDTPKNIESFRLGDKEIESIEKASESATPTVWIYVRNNGARRDEMAARYCKEFHASGIKARSVKILDSDAKKRGKFIELGEKRCD